MPPSRYAHALEILARDAIRLARKTGPPREVARLQLEFDQILAMKPRRWPWSRTPRPKAECKRPVTAE